MDDLGVKAELLEGDHGVFDIEVGGDVVFSKQEQKGFIPTPAMVELVKKVWGSVHANGVRH